MTKIYKPAIVAAALTLLTTAASPTTAASTVQKTKDDCSTAWATLMSSHPSVQAAFPHVEYKEAILHVTGPASGYVAGQAGTYDLFTFDTRFVEGGTSYVAHCGAGSTCNALGDEVVKRYPEAGTVYIYCTNEPPHVLENPQAF